MSFILDALRKSEHERHMTSSQNASLMYQIEIKRNHNPWLIPSLLVIVVLIALALFWQMWTSAPVQNVEVSSGIKSSTSPTPQLAPPVPSISKTDINTNAISQQPQVNVNEQRISNPEMQSTERANKNVLPPANANDPQPSQKNIASRQASKQNAGSSSAKSNSNPALAGLPPLAISGFVHNKMSGNLAMINNKLVHEGEEISPGLTLVKILEDSAIFSYKGYVFTR